MNAVVSIDRVVSDAKESWDHGASPDACQFLDAHPAIGERKSIVLELAYEEYFRRSTTGEKLNVDEFCERFSICKSSLRRRIEVHEFLHENVEDWLDDQAWPEVGENFGDFSLVCELGRGVESRVFLAKQRALSNRLVVLKFSHLGYREARVMSTLEHPHIVPVLSVEEEGATGLAAICMPYLSPWTLTDVLDAAYCGGTPPKRFADVLSNLRVDDAMPPPTVEQQPMSGFLAKCSYYDGVLHIISQVACALRHTHERGILHLDLKPSNILITSAGVPMLLDFNLSAAAEMQTAFGGTLPYMSAEQLQQCLSQAQSDTAVTEASDVFSLGVVTYQLLHGRLPYGPTDLGGSTSETADTLLREQANGPSSLGAPRHNVDRAASSLVERSLSYEVDQRPQSMTQVHQVLQRSLSATHRLKRWCYAHRLMLTLLLVVGVVGLAGGAYSMATQDPPDVRWHDRGEEHFLQGEFDEAIACYSKAVDFKPSSDVYRVSRGRARQAKADLTGAINDYQAAFSLRQLGEYRARVAHCYAMRGDNRIAIRQFEQAIDEGVSTPGLYLCLGRCYQAQGDHLAAISAYHNALNEDPESWRAHYGVAKSHTSLAANGGDSVPELAVFHIEHAAEINPNSWLVAMVASSLLYEYGRTNFAPADVGRAIDHFERSLQNGIPKDAAESFRAHPELNRDPRFQALINGYDPAIPSPPKESHLPDPILHIGN